MKSSTTLTPFVGLAFILLLAGGFSPKITLAEPEVRLSQGQTVYIPAYSHIYHTDKERPFYLTATLSVRNVDPVHSISVVSVEYFDNDGKLLRSFLEKPVEIGPLVSRHYSIKESDKRGGFGANFIVRWKSKAPVNEPLIECVMISTRGKQGISFITRGRVIKE
ncbi:MAG: DUF3124 domain-containing protein [Thermodesulfobacteriota bacterium]|nr:DUF3124 domain-containing protein [Thermodesulfobacteriota bacterium]